MTMLSRFRLVVRSLLYYRRAHLAVILGTAISTMVITGTLMVGDSVRSSLETTARMRLGETTYALSGSDRYFRAELAAEISRTLNIPASPVLQVKGIASAQGGELQKNNVSVIGIDESFSAVVPANERVETSVVDSDRDGPVLKLGKSDYGLPVSDTEMSAPNSKLNGSNADKSAPEFEPPAPNEAFISENLAGYLELSEGDFFVLRTEKISAIPKNAPFVSEGDRYFSMRLKVARVLGASELGRFNLKASQTAPYNVFLPLYWLNDRMDQTGKANRILFPGNIPGTEENLLEAIREAWTLKDMALNLGKVEQTGQWELSSDRVFIESGVVRAAKEIDEDPEEILTYFVNSIELGPQLTPYSFISAMPVVYKGQPLEQDEILINTWMADDLDAKPGDSLKISYFVIGPLRELVEKSEWFRVRDIVPMSGRFADRQLMPEIPGLTDAGNCSDWDTSVPVNLDLIRNKDEEYWNQWRGLPKGFINYQRGRELWENRFGTSTAIRFDSALFSREMLVKNLTRTLDPAKSGIYLRPVKEEGLKAARSGVDFAQLFMGLSFFLLVGGVVLLALLYNLHLDKRMNEAGTLKSLGYPDKMIRNIFLSEGLMIAVPGIIGGGLLAVLYNKLVFAGLNTVWSDIVMTSVLEEEIRILSLVTGMVAGLLLAGITMYIIITRKLRAGLAGLQRGRTKTGTSRVFKWVKLIAWITGIAALGLLGMDILEGGSLNPALFFTAGGLLLLSLSLLTVVIILNGRGSSGANTLSITGLTLSNIYRKPSRSIRIILLFAVGTFVIVSTGLNQKDLYSGSEKRSSGTGGFLFYAETTLPVLIDLDSRKADQQYDLDPSLSFVQMRRNDGDDASCLNLNRVSQPRILGLDAEKLNGHFSFVKSTGDMDPDKPWSSLEKTLPGKVIPAFADQTVIQWGLGKKVGDTLIYWDEDGEMMRLKLIGGLSNSIFQGNVLIDETHFLEHYPSSSGSHVFLIDGNRERQDELASGLKRTFRDEGLELEQAATRLASFNQVENTYLSIFMLLGGLGMILGTIGLGVSLARTLLDRRHELGLLKAVGFSNGSIMLTITGEHMILLMAGTLIGALSAFTATLPSILSAFVDASWQTAAIIIALILLNGLVWIYAVTRNSLNKPLIPALRSE